MAEHPPYVDPVLGTATWDDTRNQWELKLNLATGHQVEATITPEDNRMHLSSPEFEESIQCVRWVRDNELTLRQYVADSMYELMLDWHDPEWGPPLSKEQFRDKIALTGVLVLEDHRASIVFSDADCFGGHAITFSVGADGKFDDEPYLWG